MGTVEGRIGFSRIEGELPLDMRFVLRSLRRYRQFDLADTKLLVEVRKLSSGVLQKEFRLEEQDGSEDVQKTRRR